MSAATPTWKEYEAAFMKSLKLLSPINIVNQKQQYVWKWRIEVNATIKYLKYLRMVMPITSAINRFVGLYKTTWIMADNFELHKFFSSGSSNHSCHAKWGIFTEQNNETHNTRCAVIALVSALFLIFINKEDQKQLCVVLHRKAHILHLLYDHIHSPVLS